MPVGRLGQKRKEGPGDEFIAEWSENLLVELEHSVEFSVSWKTNKQIYSIKGTTDTPHNLKHDINRAVDHHLIVKYKWIYERSYTAEKDMKTWLIIAVINKKSMKKFRPDILFHWYIHLYIKTDMGENNFRVCEEVQQDGGFRGWGEVDDGKKGTLNRTLREWTHDRTITSAEGL